LRVVGGFVTDGHRRSGQQGTGGGRWCSEAAGHRLTGGRRGGHVEEEEAVELSPKKEKAETSARSRGVTHSPYGASRT
jgi:hypothetical protein